MDNAELEKVEYTRSDLVAEQAAENERLKVGIKKADQAANQALSSTGAVKVKALLQDFEDFIDQPPQYEDQRMVRDYRHELYRKWSPLCRAILSALEDHPRATSTVVAHETANVSDKPEGQQPVAWIYELASYYDKEKDVYSAWKPGLSREKPNAGRGQRNVRPLFTLPSEQANFTRNKRRSNK